MTTKPVLVIVFVLLVIATFVVSILYFSGFTLRNLGVGGSPKNQITQTSNQQPATSDQIKVPEPNEKDAGDAAVPMAAYPALSNSETKVRSFVLTIENESFNIQKIAVNENDIISLKVYSVDGEYKIAFPAFGIRQTVGNKQTKLVEFQATPVGTFPFYCENCANTGKSQGEIVIVQKN